MSLKPNNETEHCPRCLINLPPQEIACANCAENNFRFDRIIAAYGYVFPLDKILHQLKYHGNLEYSQVLSQLFWAGIAPQINDVPELIIPVTLHESKQKIRGFNQVHELLREFRSLNPKIKQLNIIRRRVTEQQASLNKLQRIKNIRGAFKIKTNMHNKHVAIIDDVVTSGTTVNEIARRCKALGAHKVDVWCLMRAQS